MARFLVDAEMVVNAKSREAAEAYIRSALQAKNAVKKVGRVKAQLTGPKLPTKEKV